MDIIKERFREASFRDAPFWQPWATGVEQASMWHDSGGLSGTESWFRLASPKLRLDPAISRPKRTEHPATGAHPLAMEEGVRLIDKGIRSAPVQVAWDGGQPSAGQPSEAQGHQFRDIPGWLTCGHKGGGLLRQCGDHHHCKPLLTEVQIGWLYS